MFGTRIPRYRTRSGMFDDMVIAQIKRLSQAWPNYVRPVQFAVEDVPPSAPAPWEERARPCSHAFPGSHGMAPRIVLYRLPLQTAARDRVELQYAIRDELVDCIAQLYGRRPDEIDPDWGR